MYGNPPGRQRHYREYYNSSDEESPRASPSPRRPERLDRYSFAPPQGGAPPAAYGTYPSPPPGMYTFSHGSFPPDNPPSGWGPYPDEWAGQDGWMGGPPRSTPAPLPRSVSPNILRDPSAKYINPPYPSPQYDQFYEPEPQPYPSPPPFDRDLMYSQPGYPQQPYLARQPYPPPQFPPRPMQRPEVPHTWDMLSMSTPPEAPDLGREARNAYPVPRNFPAAMTPPEPNMPPSGLQQGFALNRTQAALQAPVPDDADAGNSGSWSEESNGGDAKPERVQNAPFSPTHVPGFNPEPVRAPQANTPRKVDACKRWKARSATNIIISHKANNPRTFLIKWAVTEVRYFEVEVVRLAPGQSASVGLAVTVDNKKKFFPGWTADSVGYQSNGELLQNNSLIGATEAFQQGDIIGFGITPNRAAFVTRNGWLLNCGPMVFDPPLPFHKLFPAVGLTCGVKVNVRIDNMKEEYLFNPQKLGFCVSRSCRNVTCKDGLLRHSGEVGEQTLALSMVTFMQMRVPYYELQIVQLPRESILVIGASLGVPFRQLPGSCGISCGWYSTDGKMHTCMKMEDKEWVSDGAPIRFGVGDTIGCGADLANKMVFFTLNGDLLKCGARIAECGALFPAIGIDGGVVAKWKTATSHVDFQCDIAPLLITHEQIRESCLFKSMFVQPGDAEEGPLLPADDLAIPEAKIDAMREYVLEKGAAVGPGDDKADKSFYKATEPRSRQDDVSHSPKGLEVSSSAPQEDRVGSWLASIEVHARPIADERE